ncbi:sporulation protein [Streptoalloteichus tenebrarius]|uniref:sporulation protein n=1 Tax=Streptoalloteichus tenebrarius (strain ATCC 17920 / DSM 40477 / JCM 4838 / CBS 697.72 / NBRC 16177 / NCIMB 11028 / NRRL B-12390 / A12253. 1 / ISP 5477) TaxID=1933 RepID=UPI0020A2D69B|nr:sporulation protein [Streptoalloteichus tenebrarius]
MFKRMLRAFGVGGPTVDTVLPNPNVRPGETLVGEVRVQGGDHEVDIEHIALALVTRVEREHGDSEREGAVEFHRAVVSGPLRLGAREPRVIPFQIPLPWETPLTTVSGQPLYGMALGLRTEVAVAKAVDKGDMDPVFVHPLPSQDRVLDAFGQLGFQFRRADLELGHIHGVAQQLPFYQEIEFFPPGQYAGRINEVELTFVTSPVGVDVVLEADKRGGMFRSGGDVVGRFHVSHEEALTVDWAGHLHSWLEQVASRHSAAHHGYGVPEHHGYPHGGHYDHHGHYGHPQEHHHRRGMGAGAVVAGAAAGFVGGMIAGEVIDEVGDAFFGDDEEA